MRLARRRRLRRGVGIAALTGFADIAAVDQMGEALLPAAGAPVVEVGERCGRTLPDRSERVEAVLGRLGQLPPMGPVRKIDAYDELPRQQTTKQGVEGLYRVVAVSDGSRE